MTIAEIIEKLFIKPQEKYLQEHFSSIIECLRSNPDKLSIECREVDIPDIEKKLDDPTYLEDEFLKFTEHGFKILASQEGFIERIKGHIPKTIKELTISSYILEDITFLKDFKELDTLNITDYPRLSPEDIAFLSENTNIRNINLSSMYTFNNIQGHKGFACITGDNYIADYDGLTIRYQPDDTYSENLSAHISSYTDFDHLERLYNKIAPEVPKVRKVRININNYEDGHHALISFELSDDSKIKTLNINSDSPKEIAASFERVNKKAPVEKTLLQLPNRTYEDIHYLKSVARKSDLKIDYGQGQVLATTYEGFRSMREAIDYYKELITSSALSPVEKITYAYDILKSFKYQESDEDFKFSRNIPEIMDTGNIVCVGYTKLLNQLLTELGFNCLDLSVGIEEKDQVYGHERSLIRVDDDKYNIHGLYAVDATWDSDHDVATALDENGKIKVFSNNSKDEREKEIYDALVLYRHFLIPIDQYEKHFPNESVPELFKYYQNGQLEKIAEGREKINFDLNVYVQQQYKELFPSPLGILTETQYFSAKRPDLETFQEILTTVRKSEGYTQQEAKTDVSRTIELNRMLEEQKGVQEPYFKSTQIKQ